ncbi:MAG TPA: glycosyltransferase family 2 protein, partial [Candidatus Sulfomarinibacteraceae bacterium]|nr:glycosyltransferase family 2 protein [Candidatus Sulfomarinibacteraceae bacterium]
MDVACASNEETVPSVTVIVLNWNARALLARCLPSLLAQRYGDYRVVLVDNASTDDSLAFVRREFPQVEIIENDRNRGFSAGNNAALRRLQSDVAVLVNPDIIAGADWLRELMAGLSSEETIGIAGGKLFYPGQRRLQHAGGLIHFPLAMPDYVGRNEPDEGQHDRLRDVDYVVGAGLAVRRETLQQIGLLDEGFFLYFEDADLCFRARRAGYRVVYVPGAEAVHEESALTGKESPAYLTWFHSSRWRFLLKHAPQETLLQGTLDAEKAWLVEAVAGSPQRAYPLSQAYGQTLRTLWQALQARETHGAAPLDKEAASQIAGALSALRETAWDAAAAPHRERLRRRQALHPFAYRSRVPLLGPLIAALRRAWSRVAARPVLDAWRAQQVAFNRAVVQALDA